MLQAVVVHIVHATLQSTIYLIAISERTHEPLKLIYDTNLTFYALFIRFL